VAFVADIYTVLADVSSLFHVLLAVAVKASEEDLSVKRSSIGQSLGAFARLENLSHFGVQSSVEILRDIVVPQPLPRISVSVGEAAIPLACSHVVDARVDGAEDGTVFSLTMFGVIAPESSIYISMIVAIVLPDEGSLSFEVSFTPFALVRIAIQILSFAKSVLLMIEPRANIGRTVSIVISSLSVSFAFIIVAVVSISDSPGVNSLAVGVSLPPVSRIRISIGPSLDAETVWEIASPLALEKVIFDRGRRRFCRRLFRVGIFWVEG
jgi:hypothetical protein